MSIVFVIICHVIPLKSKYNAIGHMGVLFFFALSGYLITTKLREEYQATGRISLRDFYLRRAFRILPPAITYLGVLTALMAMGWVSKNYKSIVAALFFFINYAPLPEIAWKAGHFWSLSVEEHFYLIWPSLLVLSGVVKGWRTALVGAIAICVWRASSHNWSWWYHTDYVADTLLWGCCLAFVPKRRLPYPSVVIGALFASFWLLEFGPLNPLGRPEAALAHLMPTLILGAVVMSPESAVGHFLELAPVRFVGRLSYSLYIWQEMFLGDDGNHLPLPLALLGIFACAYVSYRFIELPAIAYGKRLTENLRALPVAVKDSL